MQGQDPPPPESGLRGLVELAFEVRRSPERIRRDVARGRLQTTQVTGRHLFNREQWQTAIDFYRQLDATEEGKGGAERPE